jgi:hypothetical protein
MAKHFNHLRQRMPVAAQQAAEEKARQLLQKIVWLYFF